MAIIEVDDLRKSYGDTVAVDDVSFTVERGEILGILGRNGAGKTTTVECIEGLRRPDAGRVRVCGLDPQTDRARLRQVLGIQLQSSELPHDLQVGEAVELYRRFHPKAHRADADRLLADLGLTDKRHTRFQHLSGGQAQRLSIALALVGNPRVAVLDELTTGLDPQARRDTWGLIERIRDAGVTVVLVTHFMDEAEHLCDRLVVIDEGRVAATGAPRELIARAGGDELRLITAAPFDLDLLRDLEEVTDVTRDGGEVVVTGTGNLLHAATSTLLRHDVVVTDTTQRRASLDDAFLAITGRRPEEPGVAVEEASR
ncbi:ABC transporter ATP-binding protein [Nitriliruptoraceae bacterium ZYF776]|nr:ABC transporter ATP-binding protein [Profundirhabdus halotolerans]